MEKIKGIRIYLRVSTTYQADDGVSLDQQQSKITDYAIYHKIPIMGCYKDAGISGKEMRNRPELNRLLEEIQPGEQLVVVSLSRLARNLRDSLNIYDTLKRKNCTLCVLDMNLDTSTPIGDLVFKFQASLAEFESKMTSERVKSNMNYIKKVNDGKIYTKPKYGYRISGEGGKEKPIEIEGEQRAIQHILHLKNDKEMSISEIVKYLNDNQQVLNFPIRQSKVKKVCWNYNTIKRIIDDKFYKIEI